MALETATVTMPSPGTSTSAGQQLVRAALARGYARRPRWKLVEWTDAHRVLTDKDGQRKGAWRTAAVPYMHEIAEAMGSGLFRMLTVLKPTQTGFTEWLINLIAFLAANRPAAVMLAMPAKESLMPVMGSDGRIYRALSLIPSIAPQLRERFASQRMIRLPSMDIHAVGSGSERQGQSKHVRYVLADDGQGLSEEFLDLLLGRTTSYSGREMIVVGGTAGYEDTLMDKRYKAGDRRRYVCPCPACGTWQSLEFAQIRWGAGQAQKASGISHQPIGPDAAFENAVYQCAACRERLPQSAKPAMLEAGVWVPTRWGDNEVETELFAGGAEGVMSSDAGSGLLLAQGVTGTVASAAAQAAFAQRPWRHASWWIKGAMHALEPWGKLAYEFVSKGKPGPKWWNERVGEPSRTPGQRVELASVHARMVDVELGGYSRATVPAGVLMLVAACDVQQNRVVFEIAGYGERGLRATVNAGEIPYTGDAGLASVLRGLARSEWRLDSRHPYYARGYRQMGVFAGVADSGKWRDRVYAAVRGTLAAGHPLWFACKGVGQEGIGSGGWKGDAPFTLSRPEKRADGRGVREDSVVLLRVHVNHYKDQLGQILSTAAQEGGATDRRGDSVPGVDAGTWLMPAREPFGKGGADRLDEWWARQLISEERRVTRTRAGKTAVMWAKRQGMSDNHALDVAVYADALAESQSLRQHTLKQWLDKIKTAPGVEEQKGPRAEGRGMSAAERRQRREDGKGEW